MKLELKHLAPYLPYKLKVFRKFSSDVFPMVANNPTVSLREGINIDNLIYDSEEYKPILRPLSDLTDEIINEFYKDRAENGVMVSDYSVGLVFHTCTASYKIMGEPYTDFIYNRNSINETDYWIVQKMLQMHFDVFGLIEKGLAIDINTLNK